MKRYVSHKVVQAFKIEGVQAGPLQTGQTLGRDEVLLLPDKQIVTADWIANRVHPAGDIVGGYFVKYADGYCSWSPAGAFEAGYTEVPADAD